MNFPRLTIALFAIAIPSIASASMPTSTANLFTILELRIAQTAPDFRVQIMQIGRDVFIDPAPGVGSFERHAAFVLTIAPSRMMPALADAIRLARKSNWKPTSLKFYPRWQIRFVGPWNEILGNLLIDEENRAIFVDGTWYEVDVACIGGLTKDIVKAATDDRSSVQVNPTSQP